MIEHTILGIETSCDETAAAVYHPQLGILSNELFSQIDLHKEYGGVVPEIASRAHIEKIIPIVQKALDNAQMTLDDIDSIAITTKPGLPGSLLVGLCFAKSIALATGKPLLGINHLDGHIYSACIEHDVPFPFLCLTASGGHTSLYLVKNYHEYDLLGTTLNDAAGEAFDKVAKLIDLGYPGGPIIEQLASQVGFEDFFNYPRLKKKDLTFSFSGLKTAVLYDLVKRNAYDLKKKLFLAGDNKELKQQVASSFLTCVSDIFADRIKIALKQYPEIKAVTFVGGVACNSFIKEKLETLCERRHVPFFSPSHQYCTDNAAMIAFVGSKKAELGTFDDLLLDIF